MSNTVIQVENLWKEYRLGVINHHTLTRDMQSWWARVRGKEDPNLQIGSKPIGHNRSQSEDRFWALRDVSFEVKRGDILGIIGRNGAGKSTLLKILSQVTAPTKGEVRYKGRIASLLEVGTGFHPELTGRENIFLNGAILGMSKAEIRKKFDEIIAFAEVEKFIDTPVKRYSSGMYVRLAFAVAAHLEPEILIVDEVLAVGDAQFQKKCLGKMGEVRNEGRTVLFVSHNMSAIKTLCSRSILLKEGKMVYDGDVYDSVHKYLEYGSRATDLKSWNSGQAPCLSSSKLLEVGLLNASVESNSYLPTEESIQIYIIFEVAKEAKLGTTVILNNNEGQMVFTSISNHEKHWHGKTRPTGFYRSICKIPPNFLAVGKYTVSIGFWEGNYDEGFVERDVLEFTVYEEGYVKGDLPYNIKNVLVMPILDWFSEKVH
jgi:lipopolysaccharide transport system ATP-binding protein